MRAKKNPPFFDDSFPVILKGIGCMKQNAYRFLDSYVAEKYPLTCIPSVYLTDETRHNASAVSAMIRFDEL